MAVLIQRESCPRIPVFFYPYAQHNAACQSPRNLHRLFAMILVDYLPIESVDEGRYDQRPKLKLKFPALSAGRPAVTSERVFRHQHLPEQFIQTCSSGATVQIWRLGFLTPIPAASPPSGVLSPVP